MDRNSHKNRGDYGSPRRQEEFRPIADVQPPTPEAAPQGSANASRSQRVRAWRPGRRQAIILTVLILAVGAVSYLLLMPGKANKPHSAASASSLGASSSTNLSGLQAQKDSLSSTAGGPSFKPLVPADKPQLAKPNSGTSAYSSNNDGYTFKDLFMAVPIQVSEQRLPSGYPSVSAAVSKIAASLGATTAIADSKGPAYTYTDSKGIQTVVFSTQGLLIFIQTDYPREPTTWPVYLDSLQ